MSQAGFGDSSSQESIEPSMPKPQTPPQSVSANIVGEPKTLFNALPRQALEQELQFCNERTQQAQVLLRQAQEQLQLSQLVIQRQETLTQTLQSRIDQLERELQDVHSNCDELRNRLKRQQHHTSQLKAALERCLDTSTPANHEMATSALDSWSVAKLAEEKIPPVQSDNDAQMQNVVKITPTAQATPIAEKVAGHIAEQLEQSFQNVLIGKADIAPKPQTEIEKVGQDAIAVPEELSNPAKVQPISPLIVRPHKAYQGSPIAALNLPPLQTSTPVDEPEQQPREIAATVKVNVDTADVPSSALTSSPMVSTVAAPKFMQALYGNTKNNEDLDRDESEQVAIANASPRKVVNSLAAVQLPQFPPLPRR